MRKEVIIFLVASLFCRTAAYSQIEVYGNGNVTVNGTLATSSIPLSVGNKTYNSSYSVYASSANQATGCYNIGAEGYMLFPSANIGRAYGVRGVAGNCTEGWNFGVAGVLQGSKNGAGIFGSSSSPLGVSTRGKYAGYFEGDIKVTGVAKTCWANPNDTEVIGFDAIQSPIAIINSLHTKMGTIAPVVYSNGDMQSEEESERAGSSVVHYAFIPGYTQSAYPSLVCQTTNGSTYMNYTEVMPILVGAIKQLYALASSMEIAGNGTDDFADNPAYAPARAIPNTGCGLTDISPSPFTTATVVKYTLPGDTGDAWLRISDMQHTPILHLPLDISADRTTVNGNKLQPCMYLCKLVVNGKEVDSKRIILTK